MFHNSTESRIVNMHIIMVQYRAQEPWILKNLRMAVAKRSKKCKLIFNSHHLLSNAMCRIVIVVLLVNPSICREEDILPFLYCILLGNPQSWQVVFTMGKEENAPLLHRNRWALVYCSTYYDIRQYPVRWLLSVDISCTQSVVSRNISIFEG